MVKWMSSEMRRGWWAAGALVMTLGLTGCNAKDPDPVMVMMSALNGSGEDGMATLTQKGSSTEVSIEVSAPPNDTGAQGVHIHNGACAALGTVLVPLTPVQGGLSSTTVPYTVDDLVGGKYVINIHNSADEAISMSCGAIP